MRIHTENFTADDTDALAGTTLATLESGGQLDVFILSTQADTIVTVTPPGSEVVVQSVEVPQETRAPRVNDDTPISVILPETGHVIVNIDIVTAATVQMVAIYRSEEEV